jgi:hypothetical protein
MWQRVKRLALSGAFSVAAKLYEDVLQMRRQAEEAIAAGKAVQDASAPITQQADMSLYSDVALMTRLRLQRDPALVHQIQLVRLCAHPQEQSLFLRSGRVVLAVGMVVEEEEEEGGGSPCCVCVLARGGGCRLGKGCARDPPSHPSYPVIFRVGAFCLQLSFLACA